MELKDILQIVAYIAATISALTAVVAAIFVSRQVANIRRNREVDSLFKIIALSDNADTRAAKAWLMFDLDQGLTVQQLKADRTILRKFTQAVHFFETLGVLVNNGYVPEKLIFDKYGLLIIGAWGRLQSFITAFRVDNQSYEYAENFELLVEKYDNWAHKTPLRVARGERVKLKEGRTMLDYRKEHP